MPEPRARCARPDGGVGRRGRYRLLVRRRHCRTPYAHRFGMMAGMGISDRRIKRKMKSPERGTLRVTGITDARPPQILVTGVIAAPGIQALTVEYRTDERDRWTGVEEVAVLVDRSDPTRFLVLWDEPVPTTYQPPW